MTSSKILAGSILNCSCGKSLRLYKDYTGDLTTFKCAKCLPWCKYTDIPLAGSYTTCTECHAQYKCTDSNTSLCYVCVKNVYVPPVDPKIPEPLRNPGKCDQCHETKTVFWTYCPYAADVNECYIYYWFCEDCHTQSALDI